MLFLLTALLFSVLSGNSCDCNLWQLQHAREVRHASSWEDQHGVSACAGLTQLPDNFPSSSSSCSLENSSLFPAV